MERTRILIVEDEIVIALGIEGKLKSMGYEVTSIVNTGAKAIEKAETDKPDLILMDIRIKGEMDGIEAAEVIRKNFSIPVIFSTAYLDQERIERAKITMPFGYVLKPIQERDLKVTLEMALYVSKVDAERKQTEKALRMSEKKLHLVIETSPIGICTVDLLGNFITTNMAYELIVGYSKEDLKGLSLFEVTHPNDRPKNKKLFQDMINLKTTGFVLEKKYIRKDGMEIGVVIHAIGIRDAEGNARFGTAFIEDITERKKTEEALRKIRNELEQTVHEQTNDLKRINQGLNQEIAQRKQIDKQIKFQSKILDNIEQAIIATDIQGQVLYFNKYAAKLYKWPAEEALKMNIIEVTVPQVSEKIGEEIMDRLSKGESWSGEFMVQRKDGTTFVAYVTDSPILDNDGKLVGIVGISRAVND